MPRRGAASRRPSSTRSPTPTTPTLAFQPDGDITAAEWEGLRTLYARRAPLFLRTALPGLDPARVRWVAHHVAHAASATFASGFDPCSVLVLDGRGERGSHLAGRFVGGDAGGARRAGAAALARAALRGADRAPRLPPLLRRVQGDGDGVLRDAGASSTRFRELVRADGARRLRASADVDLAALRAARSRPGEEFTPAHADARLRPCSGGWRRCCSTSPRWLHERTGDRDLVMAGGVALNCVANSRIWREGPFERVWVQPAAGDSGTALGAALHVAHELGDARRADARPRRSGRGWDDAALAARLETAGRRLRAARRRRRRRRRGARRQPGRRLVPGPLGVRPARARAPLAARRPAPAGEPREAQRHQGPRAVPAGRADGARRARRRDLRRRPDPEPVHALHARRARRLGGAHPGRRARRRHRADPDRRPRARSRWWRACSSASRRAPACPSSSTRASTPPGGRWSTTRATRSSASAPRPSTCWRSARSSCAAPGVARAPERGRSAVAA